MNDEQAMELALQLAAFGAGFVSPNPQVGCVILNKDGYVVSSGYHKRYGGPHAEADALSSISIKDLNQARMFVTLEPCAHEGKTPSCAKAIAKLPVKEVVFGITDPHPLVAGKGAEILRQAGILATEYQGPLKQDLYEVCEHFLVNVQENRPFVSVKVASSLDGQMALKSGESKWITGEEARLHAHHLRGIHDAILIGQRTLELDNPSLDVRHPDFENKKNKVVVLLSSDYAHINCNKLQLFKTHEPRDIYFFEKANDCYFAVIPNSAGYLQRKGPIGQSGHENSGIKFLLRNHLKPDLGMNSILVEGGAKVISSFISANEADRLYLFQAPILLGAKGGQAWTEQVIIPKISERISLRNPKFTAMDRDFLITGRLK